MCALDHVTLSGEEGKKEYHVIFLRAQCSLAATVAGSPWTHAVEPLSPDTYAIGSRPISPTVSVGPETTLNSATFVPAGRLC